MEEFHEENDNYGRPLQFKLYKGVKGTLGALRLSLIPAYSGKKDQGCIFLEMAPAIAVNVYDWQNSKITMALSITDIPKIVLYLTDPEHVLFNKSENCLKLFHDKGVGTPEAGKETKSFTLSKPQGKYSFIASAVQTMKGGQEPKITSAQCTISPDEALAMGELLRSAIPRILAW